MRKIFLLEFFGLVTCCAWLGAPPIGLPNAGNTCYFNSLLQNLYNLEPVTEAFLSRATRGVKAESMLIDGYADLIARMRAGREAGLYEVLKNLSTDLVNVGVASGGLAIGEQGDPTEAFAYLTNADGKTVPIFADALGFLMGRKIFLASDCPSAGTTCSKDREILRPDSALSLSFTPSYPKNMALVTPLDVIREDFLVESYKGDYGAGEMIPYIVGKCPEILMLWIKIFTFGAVGQRIATNFDGASFLLPLDIKSLVTADDTGFIDSDTVYNLIGVSCQSGSLSGGHYVALIKDQYDPQRRWYLCNDSMVSQVSTKDVAEKIRGEGYVFFYRKKSSEQASIARQQAEGDLRNLALALKLL